MAAATVWTDVVRLGRRAVRRFGLTRRHVIFEPKQPTHGAAVLREDGCCFREGPPGSCYAHIYLRLHRVNRPTQPLKRSTIMSALAHELAHLGCADHNAQHGDLTRRIAAWLRDQGQPVSHVLHSNTGSAFLPRHRRSKKAQRRTFRRAWQKAAAR